MFLTLKGNSFREDFQLRKTSFFAPSQYYVVVQKISSLLIQYNVVAKLLQKVYSL